MSKKSVIIGRVLSGLAIAFLLFDGISKFFMHLFPPEALEASTSLGWSVEQMPIVGAILLICLAIHLYSCTSILGAVLLTGYLGGAVASHIRVDNPLFSHTLFPIYIAALIWVGLYLRNQKLRTIFP